MFVLKPFTSVQRMLPRMRMGYMGRASPPRHPNVMGTIHKLNHCPNCVYACYNVHHTLMSCALYDKVQIDTHTHHAEVCHYTCTCVRICRLHYCQQHLPPPSGRPLWPPARHSGRPACPHRPLPGGAAWSGTSGGALHDTYMPHVREGGRDIYV